eukprot:TRINITY_DN5956_c0_g1_i1.p1 TRINITY_DN5956_c0_g1~~TRINITY_DN5956_c0_g1_i1.p1  ORF type:complete len:836 (+),score=141.92 TRINITY_DN5956_c0_g1_i1:103-2610(+)
MAIVIDDIKPFVCEKTGLAVICHQCRTCEVELAMVSCEKWFGTLSTAVQRRFLFQLLDVAPTSFVRYAEQLLQPLSHRDAMYALNNVKGITDGAKAEVLLSTLHHRAQNQPTRKSLRKEQHQSQTSSKLRRQGSNAALTATVTRRMAQPGLQAGKPRIFTPGMDNTTSLDEKVAWFAHTSHWCRLSAFQRLLQHCGVDLLQPLYAHARKAMGDRGPSVGDARCDIIRLLPPPLAKYLLGFLEFRDLQQAVLVSPQWAHVAKQVMQDQTHRRDADDMILDLQKNHAHQQRSKLVSVDVMTMNGPRTIERMEEDAFCGLYSVLMVDDVHKQLSRVLHYSGGQYFVTGSSDKLVRVWHVDTGRAEMVVSGHAGSIRAIVMSEKLGLVISGSYDTSVRVWSLSDRSCLSVYRGHKSTVVALAIDEASRLVASGGKDKQFIVWSLRQHKALFTRTVSHSVTTCAVSADYAMFGTENGRVVLYRMERRAKTAVPRRRSMSRSSSASSIMTKKLSVISINSSEDIPCDPCGLIEHFSLRAHSKKVNSAHVQEYFAVTAGDDGACHLWSTHQDVDEPIHTFRHVKAVTVCKMIAGRTITASNDGKIRVWHNNTGQCIRIFRGNANCNPINQVTFTNVERMIVSTTVSLSVLTFAQNTAEEEEEKDTETASPQTAGFRQISNGSAASTHEIKITEADSFDDEPILARRPSTAPQFPTDRRESLTNLAIMDLLGTGTFAGRRQRRRSSALLGKLSLSPSRANLSQSFGRKFSGQWRSEAVAARRKSRLLGVEMDVTSSLDDTMITRNTQVPTLPLLNARSSSGTSTRLTKAHSSGSLSNMLATKM